MTMPLRSPLQGSPRHGPGPVAALALVSGLALLLAACSSASSTPAASSGAVASAQASPSPASPASPSPAASPSPTPKVTQSETAWGRIWDRVPPSFPLPAGASPVSPDRPASGQWSLTGGDPAAITSQLKTGLETLGFTTAGVDGPLEDGSRIIDSVGKPDTCHIQTRVSPTGTTITITVLYGAACPFR
ncbi:MAG TPA: hypothetical protein VEY67_04710 [Candidatus Dormibacteraeota bacterium]|nr:hypothetical protein [Candidatus Dormibacteraeota bacterium]